jgi:hypothetical protein
MTWTYDPTTARGRVRMLCTDTRSTRPILSDEEIDACLDLTDGNLLLAAAAAIDIIASDISLVFKVTSVGGTRVDATTAAAGLREHAADLRRRANAGVVYPVSGPTRGGLV